MANDNHNHRIRFMTGGSGCGSYLTGDKNGGSGGGSYLTNDENGGSDSGSCLIMTGDENSGSGSDWRDDVSDG